MMDVVEIIKHRVRIVAQNAINELAATGFDGVSFSISETGKSITVTVKGEPSAIETPPPSPPASDEGEIVDVDLDHLIEDGSVIGDDFEISLEEPDFTTSSTSVVDGDETNLDGDE